MKNVIPFFCIFVVLSCKIDHSKIEVNTDPIYAEIPKSEINKEIVYGPNLSVNPYDLKLKTHQLSDVLYDLEIKMLLFNDAYYASTNTKKDFKGKFTFFVNDSNFFTLKSNLIETPLLINQHDSESTDTGLTDWIRVNTYYKQQIEITTTEDFAVGGFIQFTIEPRCTLEKIPVIIKQKNGVLKFEIDYC